MTKEEVEKHRKIVNEGKAKEFYHASYILDILGSNSKIKSYCYFRSNMPLSFSEHIIKRQCFEMSQRADSKSIGVYRENSMKILSYKDTIPKIAFFLTKNEYEKWRSNKDYKTSEKHVGFD